MSSATSIKQSARLKPRATETREDAEPGFRVWHFFVLLSLMAATLAVVMSRQSTPENLILISLTIGAAGFAALGLYRMLAPLAASEAELVNEPLSDRLRADLEREKMLALRSIKELEFDRAMGKVSAQDFEEMAARLRARALGLMKQLDEGGSAYRALIERELQARIGNSGRAVASVGGAATERLAAAAQQPAAVAGLCACGTRNDADARFCKSCGRKLESMEEVR